MSVVHSNILSKQCILNVISDNPLRDNPLPIGLSVKDYMAVLHTDLRHTLVTSITCFLKIYPLYCLGVTVTQIQTSPANGASSCWQS